MTLHSDLYSIQSGSSFQLNFTCRAQLFFKDKMYRTFGLGCSQGLLGEQIKWHNEVNITF